MDDKQVILQMPLPKDLHRIKIDPDEPGHFTLEELAAKKIILGPILADLENRTKRKI